MSALAGIAQRTHRIIPACDESWKDEAICAGVISEDIWYPEPGQRNSIAVAKDVCLACPVQQECLDYAMALEGGRHTRFGVWGGLTPDERHEMHRMGVTA